jgi:hypothetical protein
VSRLRALALFCMVAVAAVAPAAAFAAGPRFQPRLHHDAGEHRSDPLDLRAAGFGQAGTQLSLTVRTRRPWPGGGGSVCVTMRGSGQLCVAANRAVRFRGAPVRDARVSRSGRTLRVLVHPRALGLRAGDRLRWFVRSHWKGRADRLPDRGTLTARVSIYGAPRCFGAAASGCENPALRRLVTPAPADAELMPDLPCHAQHPQRYAPVVPCTFGAAYAARSARLALIGDSHGMSFRATTEVAAQALGLKAVSLTHAGCGFGLEVDPGWPRVSKECRRHTEQVLRWLKAHPKLHSVLLASSAVHGYTEDGLRELWSRIPESVRHVYVVVDVPRVSYKTASCVKAVRKRHAVSERACAVPRDEKSLPPDPVVGAAAGADPRVRVIDLTAHFCDDQHCFPVIGGAYVYRDTNHMNQVFAATLGPYLVEGMGL